MPGKWEAITRVNFYLGQKLLNNQNTHFSNVNKAAPFWWLEIPVRKTGKQLNLLLRREDDGLIWLKCPPGTLDSNDFYHRLDKDVISLQLETDAQFLRDSRSGYNFSRHIEREFPSI